MADRDGIVDSRSGAAGFLPADAHIGQVTLGVTSLERSLAFYSGILGLVIVSRGERGVDLGAESGGRTLLRLQALTDAVPRPRRSSGLYHVALLLPSRSALGAALRRLSEQRWPITGAADHLVSEALYLDDPDGLGLELYRDRSRDEWQVADGEIVMATDPLDLRAVAAEPGADGPWRGVAEGTRVGHVHLHVPDLDAAEAFYCGIVGFSPTLRRYPGALFVAAGGYHHHLGLNVWAGRGAPPPPPSAVGLRDFTVEAAGLADREHRHEAAGVTVRCRPAG